MAKVKRIKGRTIIEIGNLKVVTDAINRYRYNDLRKRKYIKKEHVLRLISKSKKNQK